MQTTFSTLKDFAPEWRVSETPVPYPDAVEEMERRVAAIEAGTAPELFWLLEHPSLYTSGTSADERELLDTHGLPVYKTGRGGRITWHGPGQRVIYALCDLRKRGRDVRSHVCRLEDWVIRVLKDFGITGERREGRIGIWVVRNNVDVDNGGVPLPLREGLGEGALNNANVGDSGTPPPLTPPSRGGEPGRSSLNISTEEKIAAIGVRVRRWVTYHGLALNVAPDLEAYKRIIPCGLPDFGVTSLKALGVNASMADVDAVFKKNMPQMSCNFQEKALSEYLLS